MMLGIQRGIIIENWTESRRPSSSSAQTRCTDSEWKKHKHWSNITIVQPDRPGELDGIVLVKSFSCTDHIPFVINGLRARGVSDEEISELKGIQTFKKYLRDVCLKGADTLLLMGIDNLIEDALRIKIIGEKKSSVCI